MQVKIFTVPVTWAMQAYLEIQADTLEEAIQKAEDVDLDSLDAEYIDDSFDVDFDIAECINEDLL